MKLNLKTKHLHLYMTIEDKRKLAAVCKNKKMTVSEYVRDKIDRDYARLKKKS